MARSAAALVAQCVFQHFARRLTALKRQWCVQAILIDRRDRARQHLLDDGGERQSGGLDGTMLFAAFVTGM